MTSYLVVTADDFGYSLARNRGIIEAYLHGVVQRASLMVNGVQISDAVTKAKEYGLPLGLHFNISEGRPMSPIADVRSLINQHGYFRSKVDQVHAAAQNILDLDHVAGELKAQLEVFLKLTGKRPLYVDGHQHLNVAPELAETFAKVLKENDIKETRVPVQIGVERCSHLNKKLYDFNLNLQMRAKESVKIYSKYGLVWCKYFLGLTTMGDDLSISRLQELLQIIQNHHRSELDNTDSGIVCEWMTHPGYPPVLTGEEEQPQHLIAGCGEGPDSFDQSQGRKHELDILTSDKLRSLFAECNVKLISSCAM